MIRRLFLSAALYSAALGTAPAQSGGSYDLSWSSVDSGGGISTGGSYTLAGTIGQPEDTSTAPSGGVYEVSSGFLQDSTYFPVPVALSRFEIE